MYCENNDEIEKLSNKKNIRENIISNINEMYI